MIKYYCDSCKQESTGNNINRFAVPCHLYSFKHKAGYADKDGNVVSGRMDNIDLCNKCYNIAYSAALKAIGV